jgi:hypothetical protein
MPEAIGTPYHMVIDPLCMVNTIFAGGQTIVIGLNGIGTRVLGKLLPPEGSHEPVCWRLAQLTIQPEAAALLGNGSHWTATVDREGRFRVDDLPPGIFWLSARFQDDRPGSVWEHRFNVLASHGDG